MRTDPCFSGSFPFPTRFAHLDDGPVAYFDTGGTARETVVFVHGLVGDFSHFEHVAPALARDHRVTGLDLPGCGNSYKPGARHSIDRHARALLEWMSAVGIGRATLVGHSAGGAVCARAAAMEPRRVHRLALINAAGLREYSRPARWLARAVCRERLLTATLEHLAMPMIDRVFAVRNERTEKFVADAFARPRHPTLGEMARVFHDLAPELLLPTILNDAALLTMPVLLMWGDRDRLIPLEGVTRAARALPIGTLRVLRGCGHMPMIESPAAVVSALRAFLQQDGAHRGDDPDSSPAAHAA